MEPIRLLESAAKVLGRIECRFAVAGGIAANLYRREFRLTRDVDVLLLALPAERTERLAGRILEELGFHAGPARAADLKRAPMMGRKTTPVVMLVGRKKGREGEGGVDVLLPSMPWVREAVERAQHHVIDYGFARLPTITIEDFIIGKAFALQDNPSRYKDLDDLQDILQSEPTLDLAYLVARFERFRLTLPRELRRIAPAALRRAMRKV